MALTWRTSFDNSRPRISIKCPYLTRPSCTIVACASNTHFYTHSLCPYAHRVALTLAEKGVKHETTEIDLSRKPSWYYSINPNGLVPSLQVDGQVVVESLDICKFVDDHFEGPNLMPEAGSANFTLANELIDNCDRFASAGLRYCAGAGRYWGIGPAGEDNANSQACYQMALDELSAAIELHGGPYLAGNSVTLADLVYLPFAIRFDLVLRDVRSFDMRASGSDSGEHSPVGVWLHKMEQRSAVIGASPQNDKFQRALLKHMAFDFFDYNTHFASSLS